MWNIMKIRVLEAGDDSVKEKKSFFFFTFFFKKEKNDSWESDKKSFYSHRKW